MNATVKTTWNTKTLVQISLIGSPLHSPDLGQRPIGFRHRRQYSPAENQRSLYTTSVILTYRDLGCDLRMFPLKSGRILHGNQHARAD